MRSHEGSECHGNYDGNTGNHRETDAIPRIQLRHEDGQGTAYNIVGFQTKLKWKEQDRIFRRIPGLERAIFHRYGSLHRNTFIHSPTLLEKTLQFKKDPRIFFAGQITGVEGYVESTAMGLLAGINAARLIQGKVPVSPPQTTGMGGLVHYICHPQVKEFQPMNVNFGLFPELAAPLRGKDKRKALADRALKDLEEWRNTFHHGGTEVTEMP